MAQWITQPSFAKGEISPSLYGRIDLQAIGSGAKVIENMLVTRAGGLVNTPGTRFIGEVKNSAARTRLISFQFNTTQTYVLEFGNQYMRIIKDGGYVIVTPSDAPAWSSATAYTAGAYVTRSGVIYQCILAHTNQAPPNATYWYALTMTGSNGIAEIATPYLTADLPLLKYMQSADVMTLTHTGYETRELTRSSHITWTLAIPTFQPTITVPAITSGSFSSAKTGATYTYKATAVDANTSEESLPTAGYSVVGATDSNWLTGEYLSISGTAPAAAGKVNIYKNLNGVYGFIGSAIPSGGVWSFNDTKISPDTLDAPQEARTPFNGVGKYPQCSTYYEQRATYGGSTLRPQGFDMSQSGNYHNFNVSSPSKADDAISRNIAARQVHEIRHFVPIRELLLLTSGGVWKVSAGGSTDVVTPTSMTVRLQSGIGVSHVPPITIGDVVLYVQEKGSIVRDLGYSFQADNYVGADLSVISSHLFEGRTLQEWAYAAVPYSVIWGVLDNGQLVTLTYLREQELVAWTHQVTDGYYESVATVSEGNEDAVYVIVRRTIGGVTKRYVERFASRIVSAPENAFFVHCGLSYSGAPVSTVSGLGHLEGKTVAILADGNVLPQVVVTGGSVTLPVTAQTIHVGLPYTSELETLPIGDTQGGIGKRKKTVRLRVRVERSRGMWAGPNRNDMTEQKRDPLWSSALKTEEIELLVVPENTEVATVVVQQRDPLPLSILALIPEVDG